MFLFTSNYPMTKFGTMHEMETFMLKLHMSLLKYNFIKKINKMYLSIPHCKIALNFLSLLGLVYEHIIIIHNLTNCVHPISNRLRCLFHYFKRNETDS